MWESKSFLLGRVFQNQKIALETPGPLCKSRWWVCLYFSLSWVGEVYSCLCRVNPMQPPLRFAPTSCSGIMYVWKSCQTFTLDKKALHLLFCSSFAPQKGGICYFTRLGGLRFCFSRLNTNFYKLENVFQIRTQTSEPKAILPCLLQHCADVSLLTELLTEYPGGFQCFFSNFLAKQW